MKKAISTHHFPLSGIAHFLVTLFILFTPLVSADLEDGLILYHPYDEGQGTLAVDASGNNHDGKISNPNWVGGISGTALRLGGAGSGTWVTVASTETLNVNACTFMAWINADHWIGNRQIVGKSVAGGCNGRAQYGLFSEAGFFKLRFETVRGRVDIITHLPPAREWVHVAFTNTGKTGKLYINGEPVSQGSVPGALSTNNDPWRIGQDCDRPMYVFAGEIDEVRLWNRALSDAEITAGFEEGNGKVLNIDTYFQRLRETHSAEMGVIPEPSPPPDVVRAYFKLDPFYKQWINVDGLPVVGSARVNPYALKEAAWVFKKMTAHRPDVLRAVVENKGFFAVMAYDEPASLIPGYAGHTGRAYGGNPAICGEESVLNYPGDPFGGVMSTVMLHEFSHLLHLMGLSKMDPAFDNRLRATYNAAMQKGLWQGNYESTNWMEYWASGSATWFRGTEIEGEREKYFGTRNNNTRAELENYDPNFAALLMEVFGNGNWRYTPAVTRTHLPHLQGFNPEDSPIYATPRETAP